MRKQFYEILLFEPQATVARRVSGFLDFLLRSAAAVTFLVSRQEK
jgi:hypothetical protein